MWILAAIACAPEPAPEEVDGLLHLFWTEYEDAENERIAEAAANLPREPQDGETTRLTEAEIDHVEIGDVDPAEARGWFIIYRYECTLEALEPILYSRHQDEQYPEADYDDYSREYTSSLDDYTSGASETLSWEVVIEGSYLNTAYTEHLLGGLRRSDDVLMARTWLPAPAEFEEGSDWSWTQDY